MFKNRPVLTFLVATLIIVILAAGAVYIWMNVFSPPAAKAPASTATATIQPTATLQPEQPTQQLAPTPMFTPVPVTNWSDIPEPLEDVSSLPSALSKEIRYEVPPENCAAENNTELSCSTREGQATNGPLTLDQNEARVSTGDEVYYFQDGAPLAMPYPDSDIPQTLIVLLNISDAPLELTMDCGWGCFRGNFRAKWTPQLLADLRDFHLWAFLIGPNPIPTPNSVGPTPVVNCGDTNACKKTNVITGIWDGSNWTWQNGMYTDWDIVGNNWHPQ